MQMKKNSMNRRDLLLSAGFTAAGLTLYQPTTYANAASDVGPVVVLGGNGFLGGDAVRSLLRRGVPTRVATRVKDFQIAADSAPENINLAKVVFADVAEAKTLDSVVRGASMVIFAEDYKTSNPDRDPKAEIDLAGIDEIENAGLSNVAKACIQAKVPRLVVASSICTGCDGVEKRGPEDPLVKKCARCSSKMMGEMGVRELYAENRNKAIDYTIARAGELNLGEARGVKKIEFNQGLEKNGIISRLDFAEVLVEAGLKSSAAGATFECYYQDTAQPVDMFASLSKCKAMGKTTEQCFFGEQFKGDKPPSLDEVLASAQEGSLFTSGREVYGKDNWNGLFASLSKDRDEAFDLGSIGLSSS